MGWSEGDSLLQEGCVTTASLDRRDHGDEEEAQRSQREEGAFEVGDSGGVHEKLLAARS